MTPNHEDTPQSRREVDQRNRKAKTLNTIDLIGDPAGILNVIVNDKPLPVHSVNIERSAADAGYLNIKISLQFVNVHLEHHARRTTQATPQETETTTP